MNNLAIKKACSLISGDMNIYLSERQMIDMLSGHPAILDALNDGALDGLFVPEHSNVLLIDFYDPERYSMGRAPNVVHTASIIPFIQKQIFNQFSMVLISKPMPSTEELDLMDEDESMEFFDELHNAALAQGYVYSSHPDGPASDE